MKILEERLKVSSFYTSKNSTCQGMKGPATPHRLLGGFPYRIELGGGKIERDLKGEGNRGRKDFF
jgi:hypothetical protein